MRSARRSPAFSASEKSCRCSKFARSAICSSLQPSRLAKAVCEASQYWQRLSWLVRTITSSFNFLGTVPVFMTARK